MIKRFGLLIKIRPEKAEEYKRYHADIWPEVRSKIKECNIRNYAIFFKDEYLFSYFEYAGSDYEADMAKMAADAKTQEWWAVMRTMLVPLEPVKPGERVHETEMEEVFHLD